MIERVKLRGNQIAGMTVLELLLASSLFSLLGLLLLAAYTQGSKVLLQGNNRSEMVRQTNSVCFRLNREIERSLYESVSTAGSACSMLSAVDNSGVFRYRTGSTAPEWQQFEIFYLDSVAKKVKLRTLSVVGTPTESTPSPIELHGPLNPLTSYLAGGSPIAHNIYAIDFSINSDHQLRVSVGAELARPGQIAPDRLVQSSLSNFRN